MMTTRACVGNPANSASLGNAADYPARLAVFQFRQTGFIDRKFRLDCATNQPERQGLMQIELLETFLDLIETGSFNRTAERLGVTQSTVSGRIAALETALGARLFDRSKAGTGPTPAGKRFAEHAVAMRHEWNEAKRATAISAGLARSLRIGLQNDLAASHIGDWVAQFRRAAPDTAIYVEPDYSNQMNQDLLNGELDIALMFSPRSLPDLHHEMIGEVTYRMVSTHAERLADVEAERYVTGNYSPAFARIHQRLHPQLSQAPVASGQNAAICGLIARLGGSAYVLDESARELSATGKLRLVSDAEPIGQPVFLSVHVRNRAKHRKILAIARRNFGPGTPVS
jgi:DNA-binding transcriptional LysR family regulator